MRIVQAVSGSALTPSDLLGELASNPDVAGAVVMYRLKDGTLHSAWTDMTAGQAALVLLAAQREILSIAEEQQ